MLEDRREVDNCSDSKVRMGFVVCPAFFRVEFLQLKSRGEATVKRSGMRALVGHLTDAALLSVCDLAENCMIPPDRDSKSVKAY